MCSSDLMHISFPVTALTYLRPGTNINILVFHFCSLENVSPYKDIAFSLEKNKKNLADTPNYLIIASFIAKNNKKAPPKRGFKQVIPSPSADHDHISAEAQVVKENGVRDDKPIVNRRCGRRGALRGTPSRATAR